VLRATGLNFGREHEVVSPKFKLEVLFAETCQRELENHTLVSRHVDVCRRVGVARAIVALIRPPEGTAGPGTAPLPGPFAAPGTPATPRPLAVPGSVATTVVELVFDCFEKILRPGENLVEQLAKIQKILVFHAKPP